MLGVMLAWIHFYFSRRPACSAL